MNVIITGATGFIGSSIFKLFLSKGHSVTILSRTNSSYTRIDKIKNIDNFVYDSLLDKKTIDFLIKKKPDVFIHCAWMGVGGEDRNEIYQIRNNLVLTMDSVELAYKTNCQHWIGLGSQAEYGNQNKTLTEDAITIPTTLYGKAKLSAGIAALGICDAYKIKGTWARVFSTYGPGDSPKWFIPYIIGEFIQNKVPQLTKCEQIWDYLYVEDAADAIYAIAKESCQGIYNLGSGNVLKLKDVVELIKKELKSSLSPNYGAIDYRDDQVMHLEANISKLKKNAKWQPKTSIEEGIKNVINYNI